MGCSRWDGDRYATRAMAYAGKDVDEIFTNKSGCDVDLDPKNFAIRESVDSAMNPNSTPVIVGCDDTGSMGMLAEQIIKEGLGVIAQGILDRKPIVDPHILLAAIGDATCDRAPLQTTQFEADTVIVDQVEKFFIERGGGGNNGESYALMWWFALNKTKCDSLNKRNRKGYLFTIGDECYLKVIRKEELIEFMNTSTQSDIDVKQLLEDVQKQWNVFHLIVETEATRDQDAIWKWKELLGERAIVVSDVKKLGEVIVSIMQVNEGQDKDEVIDSWDGDTSVVVASSVKDLVAVRAKESGDLTITEI